MLNAPKIVDILNDLFATWGLTSEAKEIRGHIEYSMQNHHYNHPVNLVIEYKEMIEQDESSEESDPIEVTYSIYFNISSSNHVTPFNVYVGNLVPDIKAARRALLPIIEKVIAWQLSRSSKKLDRIDFKFVPFVPADRPTKQSKAVERPVPKIVLEHTEATATNTTKAAVSRPVKQAARATNRATERPVAKPKAKAS